MMRNRQRLPKKRYHNGFFYYIIQNIVWHIRGESWVPKAEKRYSIQDSGYFV